MQSILQYRRFRIAVEAQLERDKAKAQAYGHHGREGKDGQRSPISNSGVEHKFDLEKVDLEKVDLEKGEDVQDATDDINQSTHLPYGVNPGEANPDIGGALPSEEEETMRHNQRPAEFLAEAEEAPKPDDDDEEDDNDGFKLSGRKTLSRSITQQTAGTALGAVLTGIRLRRRTTGEGGDGNVFVVGYESANDPNDPHNWGYAPRFFYTFTVASIGCVVGLASAIDSSAIPQAAREFGVSPVVESMATGLFLVGFGAGALFAGPISETVGRNPVYITTLVLYMLFVMASGLAPNIGSQLAFRFLAGFFGSTPLTCAGGSISDLWNPMERVFAFPIFANAAFTGPLLGPVMGGFIAQNLDWRWVDWITLLFSALVLALVVLLQPETYPPVLLSWKARHLREITGDQRYRADIEVRQQTFLHRLQRALYRPFLLTAREPIIILIALYLSVIYIVLFTFLVGYTYIFQVTYGISQGLTGVCFLGIIIGLCGASVMVPILYKWAKIDLQKIKEAGGDRLPPEFSLWYSMLGGAFALPISLFWMAWTDYPHISIWSPLAASVLFGYGVLCVFITCYQYIIDSYESFAASALASITVIRYFAAGGMTVVAIPFYENLGTHYTLTILACLSALLVPVPYAFYRFGPWIRSKSKFATDV